MSVQLSARSRLGAAALLVVLAPMLAGCTPGAAPPSICAVCDDRMVGAAAQEGANISVSHSEVHLYLRTGGSARWEVRVSISGDGVDAFRSNESLRRTIVERRLRQNRGPAPSEPQNLTVRMDDGTLVVGFVDAGFADRRMGDVLLVDAFHHQTASTATPPFVLRADQMVLHAPDGWVVLNQVPGAETRTDAAVWYGAVHERTYVVAGPEDGLTEDAYGQIAVAEDVAGWATGRIVAGSILPVGIIVIGLVVAFGRMVRPTAWSFTDGETYESVGSCTVTGLGILAVGASIVVWHAPASRMIGGVLSSLSGPDAGSSLPAIGLFVVLLVTPPVLGFVAAGLLAHRGPSIRWPVVSVTVATVPLEVLWMVLVAPDVLPLVVVLTLFVAGVAAVIGIPMFSFGRRKARSLGWASETEPRSKAPEGDEHAGE